MAIPPDRCSDQYRGSIGTVSPLARINFLLLQAKKNLDKDDGKDGRQFAQQELIFDAMAKLIVSLELAEEKDRKTVVCTAIAYLMSYLNQEFHSTQMKPLLQMQEERGKLELTEGNETLEGGQDPIVEGEEDEQEDGRQVWFHRHITDNFVDPDMLAKLQETEVKIPRFFIHPSAWKRVVWDVWVLLIVLIDSILMPYQIAYHFDNLEENAWFWIGTTIFSIDIVANFFTGFVAGPLQKDHGQVVTSPSRIAKNYLRTWFVIDFFSTFPWSYAMQAWASGGAGDADSASGTRVAKVTKVAKLARFMRLARMLKLLKLQDVWDVMENSIGNVFAVQILNLIKVIAIVVYICHWNACIWWAVGSTSSIFSIGSDEEEETGRVEKWTTRQFKNVFMNKEGEEWTRTYSWADESIAPGEKYTFCFYWTLGVMRTMPVEVYPVNRVERLYTLIFMFFAFSMFSICISRITQMYNKISTRRTEFEDNIAAVRYYMHENDIDKGLQDRIRTFLETRYARRRIFAKENAMFNELTETLRTELKCAQFVRTLQSLWIFKDLPTCELKPVVLICVVQDTAPGDILCRAGTVAKQASIAMCGSLTVDDPGERKSVKAANSFFDNVSRRSSGLGKGALVSVDVDCLLLKGSTLSEFTVWADDFCELAVVAKNEFLRVRRTQPKLNAHLETLLKSRKGAALIRDIKQRDRDAGLQPESHDQREKSWGDILGERPSMRASHRKEQRTALEDDSGDIDGGAVAQALG